MQALQFKKLAGAAVAGALLFGGSSVAFAQVYDTGAQGSGSAGTIVPGNNLNTPGITGGATNPNSSTATTGTVNTPGIPNTGTGAATTGTSNTMTTAPGIPNTGAGGDAFAVLLAMGASAAIAVGGAVYLARQKFALR